MRISDWSSDVCSSDLVAHVLVEIRAGGGLNAISVAAQKNLVEIQLQYLLLAHHRFDAIGQERFLGLTYIADFVGEEQILGDLLCNGGCPDRTTAMSQVRDHRRDDAGIIQAMMLKKGAVLSRHIGTDQQRWIIGILKQIGRASCRERVCQYV